MEHFVVRDGKKLRCGFTTGSAATLAAKAAASLLLLHKRLDQVSLLTPGGMELKVDTLDLDDYEEGARCGIRKDAGDDIDATHGALIYATVKKIPEGLRFVAGQGVGVVTKPGLDQPVGEAAINRVPRKMIRDVLEEIALEASYLGGFEVTISLPEGEEIAKKTFNPKLGIEGGVSILGTSGIVEPMSLDALRDSMVLEIRILAREGVKKLLLTPGNYGRDYAGREGYSLPLIKISNFIGDALDACQEEGIQEVFLLGHLGKMVKLAGGNFNTHSHWGDNRVELFVYHSLLCGADLDTLKKLSQMVMMDDGIAILKEKGLDKEVLSSLGKTIEEKLKAWHALKIKLVIFSNVYGELYASEEVKGER